MYVQWPVGAPFAKKGWLKNSSEKKQDIKMKQNADKNEFLLELRLVAVK